MSFAFAAIGPGFESRPVFGFSFLSFFSIFTNYLGFKRGQLEKGTLMNFNSLGIGLQIPASDLKKGLRFAFELAEIGNNAPMGAAIFPIWPAAIGHKSNMATPMPILLPLD